MEFRHARKTRKRQLRIYRLQSSPHGFGQSGHVAARTDDPVRREPGVYDREVLVGELRDRPIGLRESVNRSPLGAAQLFFCWTLPTMPTIW
jgi:hypothetical protein